MISYQTIELYLKSNTIRNKVWIIDKNLYQLWQERLQSIIMKDAIYLLLQKIEGMSLKDYILKKNNLSEKLKIKLSKQIVSIFYFLHKCNPPIIYRDLKAENILIESEKVYLTDFGLSRFYPDDNNYKMTGNTGTLRYMAPEVFKKKNYNLKVDIYSIGMIIYFIFKMKLPFDGYDKKTIIEYLDHDRNMKFNLQNVIVKKVIENCINKNIEKRFDIIQLSEQINKIKKSKYLLFFI